MKYQNRGHKLILVVVLIAIIGSVPISTFASEQEPILAPINPEFLEYINNINTIENYDITIEGSEEIYHYGRGLIPEPFMINRSPMINLSNAYNKTYPSKFDLRSSRVTSVKDQGQNGSCWAFAAYSSLESYLMPGEEWNFSEKNMRNTHGFDHGPDDGGNRSMSTAYMARGDGPILEADDPYDEYGFSSPTNLPIQKHLTNVFYIPNRKDFLDNELIKDALMEYGAVQTSIYSDDAYYNKTKSAHYDNNSTTTNHAVSIVGWDDDYSKTNFKSTPPQNGAFIVKNSWGANWGEDGYFYISYYDIKVGKNNAVYIAEDLGKHDNIYQYDPLGMTSYAGYGAGTGWFANIFEAGQQDESLNGVGFFVPSDSSSYEVFVSTDNTGNLNNRKAVANGNTQYAGYHTVNFPPELIVVGNKFAVIVKITNYTGGSQIPLEMQVADASKARAMNGQSFMGSNGDTWIDVNQKYPNTNVTLKAFTSDILDEPVVIPVISIGLNKTTLELEIDEEDTLTATINPSDATNKNITWTSNDDTVATVDSTGKVKAISQGVAIITVTTVDGAKTEVCEITVKEPKPQPDPYEGYEVWKEILTTKSDNHTWTLKLSLPVMEGIVNDSIVYIVDENYKRLDYIKVDANNSGKFGYIKLNNNGTFEINKTYWIIIKGEAIKSQSGKYLESGLKIKFVVE